MNEIFGRSFVQGISTYNCLESYLWSGFGRAFFASRSRKLSSSLESSDKFCSLARLLWTSFRFFAPLPCFGGGSFRFSGFRVNRRFFGGLSASKSDLIRGRGICLEIVLRRRRGEKIGFFRLAQGAILRQGVGGGGGSAGFGKILSLTL